MLQDEPLGVLMLIHSEVGHFHEEHGELAQAAAGQIAVALSKAQLYRYVSEQSERLGLTLQQREEEISKIWRSSARSPMAWWSATGWGASG